MYAILKRKRKLRDGNKNYEYATVYSSAQEGWEDEVHSLRKQTNEKPSFTPQWLYGSFMLKILFSSNSSKS